MALKSISTKRFWKCYYELPENIQEIADETYALWKESPFDPSLEFREFGADCGG